MRIPLLRPAPPPEDAVGWLSACHARMTHFLAVLERLPEHLRTAGLDDDAREAIQAVCRYFSEAAPLHHADEEEDVYPALLACAVERSDPHLPAHLQRLSEEHAAIEARWQALHPHLSGILVGQPPSPTQIRDFVAVSRAHLRLEEEEVLPVARRWLDAAAQKRLAREMARRRQISGIVPPVEQ